MQQSGSFQVSPELIQLYQTYQTASNPEMIMEQMSNKIPIIREIRGGGNMKDTFYRKCQEQGVNPDVILSQFKQKI